MVAVQWSGVRFSLLIPLPWKVLMIAPSMLPSRAGSEVDELVTAVLVDGGAQLLAAVLADRRDGAAHSAALRSAAWWRR